MKITILTIFPDYFANPLAASILGRAKKEGQVEFEVLNIRDYASDKHHTTDDRPFGGGAGMVMKIEPIFNCLNSLHLLDENGRRAQGDGKLVILTSAKGQLFTQNFAQKIIGAEEVIIICGHYEGVDERVAEHLVDIELRIGDYVLTGGEPAALVISDALTRLVPGVLGNQDSLNNESHGEPGVLAAPQYTRPENFKGWSVPQVLLTGNHQQISDWRKSHRGSLEEISLE